MTHTVPKFVIDAFYESKFRDNLFVIKAGGKIIEDQAILDNLISNIHDLTRIGIKILLVYGFGRAVDEKTESAGLNVIKHEGRRVTDAATLQIIKDVVGGDLSLKISQSMARSHLPGISLNAVPADWMKIELRPKQPFDFGFVGDIKSAEGRAILRMFRVSNFIACSCLGVTGGGEICNVNADTIATQIAIAVKAHKLIFLSDVDGVEINGKPADIITADQIPALIENGTVTGGMRVKLENCFTALKAGVRRIHLISGLRQNALESEIYEPVGPGTMLLMESERTSYLNEIEALKVIEAQKFVSRR
ncbi:MAG: acetylglutamate kinase [Alphaproteobacteria bacterium]